MEDPFDAILDVIRVLSHQFFVEPIVAARETLAFLLGNRGIRDLRGDLLRFLQRLMERVERMASRFEDGDARVDLRALLKVADRR